MSTWSVSKDGALLASHRYADGVLWGYSATGLTENSAPPRTNTPDLVSDVFSTFGDALRETSIADDVPLEILVSSVCTFAAEAAGAAGAASYQRFLPGFVSEDQTPQLAFVGCTGLRFDYVRQSLGAVSLADFMSTPSNAITAASRHILSRVPETHFQVPAIASAFNADGVRLDSTSRWRMANQDQTDRFVAWFNTAVAAIQADPTLSGSPQSAPTFTSVLTQVTPVTPLPTLTATNPWNLSKPESVAAMSAGVMTICETNTSLSTIWALDTTTTEQISQVALAAGSGQGLPMGAPVFQYPDRAGVMKTMTSEEVQRLYRAMRDYVMAIVLYDTNRSPSLPGQPVLLA
jgi:hypothetical protein